MKALIIVYLIHFFISPIFAFSDRLVSKPKGAFCDVYNLSDFAIVPKKEKENERELELNYSEQKHFKIKKNKKSFELKYFSFPNKKNKKEFTSYSLKCDELLNCDSIKENNYSYLKNKAKIKVENSSYSPFINQGGRDMLRFTQNQYSVIFEFKDLVNEKGVWNGLIFHCKK